MFLFILFRDALRFHHLLDSRMRSSTIHSCTLSFLSRSETDFGQSSTIRHLQERRNSVQFHLATIFGEYCSCRGIGCLLGGRERIDQQGRGTQGEEECNYVIVSSATTARVGGRNREKSEVRTRFQSGYLYSAAACSTYFLSRILSFRCFSTSAAAWRSASPSWRHCASSCASHSSRASTHRSCTSRTSPRIPTGRGPIALDMSAYALGCAEVAADGLRIVPW